MRCKQQRKKEANREEESRQARRDSDCEACRQQGRSDCKTGRISLRPKDGECWKNGR